MSHKKRLTYDIWRVLHSTKCEMKDFSHVTETVGKIEKRLEDD